MKKSSIFSVVLCFMFLNLAYAGNSKENSLKTVATASEFSENITKGTLTSGANKLINNPPTGSLVYTVSGNVVDLVRQDDVVTITATFDHAIDDNQAMYIVGDGPQNFTANMTRITATIYTHIYTVGSASGVQNFLFENGQDLEGNSVVVDPSSGASVFHNPSVINYTYEDFDLINPNAVKINIIYLTNDINLNTLPEDSNGVEWGMAQVGELLTESNAAFNELYDSTNWPGFELGRITKAYNTSYYNTSNPHAVLSDIGSQPVAQQNHLNIVVLKVNRDLGNGGTMIAGTTYQNSSTRAANGATLVLSSTDEGMVPIHEMGHVVGLPHWTGNGWPPPHAELPLYDGSVMGFTSITHSGNNSNYMGSWGTESTESFIDSDGSDSAVSLYLTGGAPNSTTSTQTFNSPDFGNISSEVFRSWLITDQYILPSASATGYPGHDTSLSVASDWVSEGVNEFSSLNTQAFPKIVTSQNENNNYAAVSFLNSAIGSSQLSYSYRNDNSVWGPVTTIQGDDGEFYGSEMAMSSDGDVIIITETWVEGEIKVFSKDVDDASWTNSLVISDSGTSELRNSRAKVSINAAGNAVAVWLRNDNNVSQIIFKERVNGSWSGATVLSVDNSKNELPSIAYNDNGDVIVSWQQWNVNSFKYEVVGKLRNGATNDWSSLENYGNSNATAGFSQVALDDIGNALVYWRQAGPDVVRTGLPTNPLTAFLNVRYRNSDGTLETIVQLTNTAEDAFNGATFHNENRVVFLEDGTAAATWWINDGTNPSVIYSSAMPQKNVWTTPVALSNGSHNATMSKIAPGKGGDYSVIWQRPDGLNTRIQTRTYHASTSNWSAISTLSDSNYDAMWGSIGSDGDNQLSAMWVRNDGTKHIPEVKRFSLNPFITKTTITTNNAAVSVSFNEAVYNAIGAAGALEANDFSLSITGGTAQLASATPTSISSNVNTYTLGVSFTGIPDGTEILTVVPSASGVIFDSGDNAASTSQNNNSVALNDMTTHTASLVYTVGGNIVSSVSEADIVTITATFNQEMADSPIVQISGSGVNSISASNMTKVNSTQYIFSWTVGAGAGIQSFELETGTNLDGTVITATPSSGATIIVVDNIAPTAALTYTITKSISPQNAESSVSAAKQGDVVTITALFSEAMADFPGIQISGSGLDLFYPINMTKVSSTQYTFDWRVNVTWDGNNFESGIQNFTLGTGTDLGESVITPTPTSGESITIDNTKPTVGLVYTIDGNTVNRVKQGDQVLITATFNEDISDQGCKINGYGSTTVPFSDMTKVSTTSYTYLWTVGAGNGNTDFGLGYGTDIVGNEITNNYMTGRSIVVDNSSPTALIDWEGVTTVASGSSVIVYVTFSEGMANSPVPKISGSGANTIAPTDLVSHYLNTIYKYIWTVGENPGTQTFSVSTGTDLVGNLVEETLTSGGSILIDILPTAALSYTVNGNAVSSAKLGDDVLITALFNKEMADSPVVQIYAEGLNAMSAADMTKINSTSYTYTLSAGSGNGNQYFRMATGTDLAGTTIETYPTSGETLIIDNTPPTITLEGANPQSIELGTPYSELEATATDNTDDDSTLTDSIVIDASAVNVNTIGSYTVTYNVSDAAGNAAIQVTRTVNVVDTTIPEITLTGANPQSIELGTSYSELGATATDNADDNSTITSAIVIDASAVDVNVLGEYTVTYNVSDAAGNAADEVSRIVNVVDTSDPVPPVIILLGSASVFLELGTDYTDAGATASDGIGGNITPSIVVTGTIDNTIVGDYTIFYNVNDAEGNPATQVTRTVTVVNYSVPVITLLGDAIISLRRGVPYFDLGATALDNTDGPITNHINIVNPVNINAFGTYTITYNVSNSAGTPAIEVTRTVVIQADEDYCDFSENFEVFPPTGWTIFNSSNPSNDITQSDVTSRDGMYSLRFSSKEEGSPYDQYLVSPAFTPSNIEKGISFYYLASDVGEVFKVGWSTTDNNLNAFTWSEQINAQSAEEDMYLYSKDDLPVGTKYVAIHYYSDHQNYLYIDRFCLRSTPEGSFNPGITLIGAEDISIKLGATYTDAGAIAFSEEGVNITANIVTVNSVDTSIEGSYTVTYNVSDAAGNAATPVTRTVTVFTSMWNGSVNNDWDTPANWSSNSVPGPGASVRIPKTGITHFPTASNAVAITAVTIESGASLITQSTFSGSLTYKRKLHLANDWPFISSPVQGSLLEDVISNTDLASGSGANVGLSIYNNSIPGWEYYSSTSSGTMDSGGGYAVLVNSGDIFFTGTMPTEPVNKSLTRAVNGWNLIGNPYPSYLAINNTADADFNFLDVNSSSLSSSYSSIYLWDVANPDSPIKVVNHATGPYDMYPGQGFFVNTISDGNSVSFTEQMQSHQTTGTFYGPIEATPSIILAIENNGDVKTTTVKYFDTATAGLDVGYDAGAFTAGGVSTFNLNTHLPENSEGIDFTLQCLSTQEYETSVIPVALTTEAGLEISFSAEALNLPTGIKVFLEDRVTNTFTRLDEANSEYIVQLDEPENGIGRFYLHTKSSILRTDTINLNNIIIYKTDASTIRIVGLPEEISTFKLFNILGAQLVKNTFMPKGTVNINLPPLPSGIYIVWLENKFGNVVKRIILE